MARLPESAARRGAGAAGVSVVSVSGVVRWLLKQKGAIMRIFLNWGDSETACHVPYCACSSTLVLCGLCGRLLFV